MFLGIIIPKRANDSVFAAVTTKVGCFKLMYYFLYAYYGAISDCI